MDGEGNSSSTRRMEIELNPVSGMSPLHISSENGHTKVVQLLLVKGSLLQRDHRGRTPLHCAAARGYTKTMHQLVLVHSHLLDQCDREGVRRLMIMDITNQNVSLQRHPEYSASSCRHQQPRRSCIPSSIT